MSWKSIAVAVAIILVVMVVIAVLRRRGMDPVERVAAIFAPGFGSAPADAGAGAAS